MKNDEKPYWWVVFPGSLGWFALLGEKDRIKEVTFGHSSSRTAKNALSHDLLTQAQKTRTKQALVHRLQAYAKGAKKDDFLDIQLDLGCYSDFQRRVLSLCRKIPFGATLSYGQLAAKAGSPHAYRAVGGCMAGNKIPILIPCHRVVLANGSVGSYSAPGGMRTKKRLLELENHSMK